jgi:starch phosphorylase
MEAVGAENFFLFGLRDTQVEALRHDYRPWEYVAQDADLRAVIDLLRSGHFNPCEPGIFDDVINGMMSASDPWVTLADFRSYLDAQQAVSNAWQDSEKWTQMSILNTAASGFFSTDRTMMEYNRDIWKLEPGKR